MFCAQLALDFMQGLDSMDLCSLGSISSLSPLSHMPSELSGFFGGFRFVITAGTYLSGARKSSIGAVIELAQWIAWLQPFL